MFTTRYTYKPAPGRVFDVALKRTRSEFVDSCDINSIIRRYKRSGVLYATHQVPTFQDFTQNVDFYQMQNTLAEASQGFEALPSHVRKRFNNDLGQFYEFYYDPSNEDELIEMKLKPSRIPEVTEPQGDVDPQPPLAADAPPAGSE